MKVPAGAFVFTRPDAVILFGKDWTDQENRRYRLHVFPRKSGQLDLVEDRPNVVLLIRADKRHLLEPYSDKIHRIIIFGTPEELSTLGVPFLDAITDDSSGRLVSAPRNTISYYGEKIENDCVPISLATNGPTKKKKKITVHSINEDTPENLSDFLECIEDELEDVDVWEDLERPLLRFVVGDLNQVEFQNECKNLVKAGARKKLVRDYYKWIVVSGGVLIETVQTIISNWEGGLSINIEKMAKKEKIGLDDLSILLSLYKAEKNDREVTDEEGE